MYIAAMEPIALHGCPKAHMYDCRGKAVSDNEALSVSLLILKHCVKKVSETYMTELPHQGDGGQKG